MALLMRLADCPGQVVLREDLIAWLWPDVIVGDDTLARVVSKLRKAFEDDARRPAYIETIPKRGYRLIADVVSPAPEVGSSAIPKASNTRPVSAPAPSHIRFGRWVAALGAVVVTAIIVSGGMGLRSTQGREDPDRIARADDLYMRFVREDNEAAFALYEAVLREAPDDVDALSGAANARVQRVIRWPGKPNEPDAGARSITTALAAGLHLTPTAKAELSMAEGQAQRAVDLAPNSARARKALGLVLSAQGRLEEAAAEYRRAIASASDAWAPHINLGELLMMQSDLDAAATHFERAFLLMQRAYTTEPQRVGKWPAALGVEIGQVHERRRDFRRAREWYERVLGLVPLHPAATDRLAAAMSREGQAEQAKALCAELASRVAVTETCRSLLEAP